MKRPGHGHGRRRTRGLLRVLLAPDYLEITMLGRFSKKEVLVSLLPTLDLHEFIISDPNW